MTLKTHYVELPQMILPPAAPVMRATKSLRSKKKKLAENSAPALPIAALGNSPDRKITDCDPLQN